MKEFLLLEIIFVQILRGANNMKFDSLFITNGIHKSEFLNLPLENYDKILNKYKAKTNYYQERLTW